jgi:hypothetical protein
MSALAKAKARYAEAKDGARRQAALNLEAVIGCKFYLSAWSRGARDALADQWPTPHLWDWNEIFRRHNDPDRLDAVIWAGERLAGLALVLTTSQYVEIRFSQGDPRADCPLKGRRSLIIVECAACYAQARGRPELRVQPVSDRLKTLYVEKYLFELATPRRGDAYYYKRV